MKTVLAISAAAVLLASLLSAEQPYYRVYLGTSGSTISTDKPVPHAGKLVFHQYPLGTYVSVPQYQVRSIEVISTRDAERTNPAKQLVSIGNLAMQGGGASGAQGGPTNASAWNATRTSANTGANPYAPGATWAYEPANAVIASPGAPPAAPK